MVGCGPVGLVAMSWARRWSRSGGPATLCHRAWVDWKPDIQRIWVAVGVDNAPALHDGYIAILDNPYLPS